MAQHFLLLLVTTALPIVAAGCSEQEQIQHYTVQKPPPPAADATARSDRAAPPARAADGQNNAILGAIVAHDAETWFFKIQAPASRIDKSVQEAFARFIQSVEFGDSGPEWVLPDGWRERKETGIRYATMKIDTESGPIEMSVTRLGTGEGPFEEQLLANVNRWRDQVGLPKVKEANTANGVLSLEIGGKPAWFVYLKGPGGGSAMGGGPKSGQSQHSASVKAGARRDLPLTFDVPEGWQPGAASSIAIAAFEVKDGKQKVTITITAAGGDLLDNVNRWRDQVGLKPIDRGEFEKSSEEIALGDVKGVRVELAGPEGADRRETILGVIAEAAGQQWFFKLRGDAGLAEREKSHFDQFIRSVHFREIDEE